VSSTTLSVVSEEASPSGYVFVSYRREDSLEVDRLQRSLEASGVRVWRDTANLWPGEDWRETIRHLIIDSALVFVVCFSKKSLARHRSYQNDELVLAIDQLRLRLPDEPWLIPVRFDDCEIPDHDIGGGRTLASLQRVDLFGEDYDEAALRLVTTVLKILVRPPTPVPFTTQTASDFSRPARQVCIAVEVAAYSSRSALRQAATQRVLESVVIQACKSTVGGQGEWEYQSRGDGLLAVSPPGIDESEIIRGFISSLHNEIRLANRDRSSSDHLRIRVAIAHGVVQATKLGIAGDAIIQAARLLESPELHNALNLNVKNDLAVIIADASYRVVFAHVSHGFSPQEFHLVHVDHPARSFSGDGWIYLPPISEGENEAPLFFLSYARPRGAPGRNKPTQDSNREARLFFDDLSRYVNELIAWMPSADPGFMDTSMRGGDRWTDELLHALGTCQVFVALLSVSYLASEWCGMEWHAFSQRRVITSRHAASRQTCLIPIVWAPVREEQFPAPVQAVQRFSPHDMPDPDDRLRYHADGIYGLLATEQRVSYQRATWQLAQLIKEIHESHLVEPMQFNRTALRNIFRE
jgi:TIR domain